MKIVNTFRALAAACTLATVAHAAAAPTLLIDNNGILSGAKNVDVAGIFYDVTFMDGSCNSVYNGCDDESFAFTTNEAASLAAQALLDQVLIDSVVGPFDSVPYKVAGCSHPLVCLFAIPHTLYVDEYGPGFEARLAINGAPGYRNGDRLGVLWSDFGSDMTVLPNMTFARFELVSPVANVPEPASVALFGLAMAGLAYSRRRKA